MHKLRYEPWMRVEDVTVPIEGVKEFNYVRIPFVYGKDVDAFVGTTKMVCYLIKKSIDAANQKSDDQDALLKMRAAKYEPPLLRFKCDECGNSWDAWVADDGTLEDEWSVTCTDEKCPRRGKPAVLVVE